MLKFCQNTSISHKDKIKFLDLIAIKIRSISIDLHNKFERFKDAQKLINLACEFARTQEIKTMCQKDLIVINQTVENRCGFNGFLNSSGL